MLCNQLVIEVSQIGPNKRESTKANCTRMASCVLNGFQAKRVMLPMDMCVSFLVRGPVLGLFSEGNQRNERNTTFLWVPQFASDPRD